MKTDGSSIFKDRDVLKDLTQLHSKYVIVPADKAQNNIVFICKKHYIDCLIKELGKAIPHILVQHLQKRRSLITTCQCYSPLGSLPKLTN